jgi:hypothetical protein
MLRVHYSIIRYIHSPILRLLRIDVLLDVCYDAFVFRLLLPAVVGVVFLHVGLVRV